MATIMTHGLVAIVMGKVALTAKHSPRFWFWVAVCAMFPDIDVVGFQFGIKYGDLWGHRGLTHSLPFAVLSAILIVAIFFRKAPLYSRLRYFLVFFAAMASHGVLDALTDGGLGVAFFSPFDTTRYFFPTTPIRVSPIGLANFFTESSWQVLESEILWICLPALATLTAITGFRKVTAANK